jgi:transposase
MSLPLPESACIPEETARLARTICPKGTLYMQIRDHLGPIYENQLFASLFSTRGQPAEAPWRLALVCIFQFIEGLTDRQAAQAVQQRIDWKYALALELSDPGFDFSVLSKFRARLLAGSDEMQLFDVLLTHLKTQGLLRTRGRQRTDSTHILAAVRTLNRLERVGETMRHALNILAEVAPDWLRTHAVAEWNERYSRRMENYRFPKAETERCELGATIGRDGVELLQAVETAGDLPWLRELPAIQTLRQVWAEQYTDRSGSLCLRDKKDLESAGDLIVSPYDTEARFSVKRGMEWIGYKVHFTESCDEDLPHLITNVETTTAAVPDDQVLESVHQALEQRDVLPEIHLVDAGYTDSEGLVSSQRDYGVTLLGPVAADPSWQAKAGEGFDKASFSIDWEQEIAICPAGKQNYSWLPNGDRSRGVVGGIRVQFASRDCASCPLRSRCTRAKVAPRELVLLPRDHYEALRAAKQRQHTGTFREAYAMRAGIESTHAQGVRRSDLRRTRYIGLTKTRLQHIFTAIALNVVRAIEWLTDTSPAKPPQPKTRVSHFAALEKAIARG